MARRLALVTGASAGIGAAFARTFAARGYDVALTARRSDRLERLADEIGLKHGVEALTFAADLADPATPQALLDHLSDHGRTVDALVNNAGYGLASTYAQSTWRDQANTLQVMVTAPAELTHKLLPGMVERGFGRIVNVASLAGLAPGAPGSTLYGGTKAFLVRFSQSLHAELKGTGVHVTALAPGFTYTEFHDVTGSRAAIAQQTPAWLWMGADEVAETGFEAVEANRALSVPGAPNKAMAFAVRLVPEDWVHALMASRGAGWRQP